MFSRIIRTLYGDITPEEIHKFSLLSAVFFFTIGTYWLLRPLKDDLFNQLVGIDYQPKAKMASVFIMIFIVMLYSKLVDMFEKHHLFYVIGGFFASMFLLITLLIGYAEFGIQHPVIITQWHGFLPYVWSWFQSLGDLIMHPITTSSYVWDSYLSMFRWLGWFTYFSIESFGSIIVALFWSFVASITEANSAKRGYALIVGGAQTGSILGASLAIYSATLGLRLMFLLATLGIVAIMLMVRYFVSTVPQNVLVGDKTAAAHEKGKKKTGFMEGLKLILAQPYIVGILIVSTLYEVIATIVDFQMKKLASVQYPGQGELASFLGKYGVATNCLALVMALLGTSYLMRRFGLTFCLLTFPVVLGGAVTYLWYVAKFTMPSDITLMWTAFIVMIVAKGLSYALNNPSKEMMYIPTSKDVKFKAKGWIDMFGNRSAKATGAAITNTLRLAPTAALMVQSGAVISLAIVAVWILAASSVGRMFAKLTKSGEIIE